jgi:hypothetical protein
MRCFVAVAIKPPHLIQLADAGKRAGGTRASGCGWAASESAASAGLVRFMS